MHDGHDSLRAVPDGHDSPSNLVDGDITGVGDFLHHTFYALEVACSQLSSLLHVCFLCNFPDTHYHRQNQ